MNYIAGAIFLIVCIICYSAQKKQQQLTGWKSIKVGLIPSLTLVRENNELDIEISSFLIIIYCVLLTYYDIM